MKTKAILTLILGLILAPVLVSAADSAVPKYDKATEVHLKGVVQDVRDYQCPISGTMGSHITLKADTGIIELHLAATKYTKSYEIVFNKGDQIEVVGSRVKFEGADTILAREITRGTDTFTFRDGDGKPVW
jgi:DNA/RNA endonuclease YhcR with UshA esterase domain